MPIKNLQQPEPPPSPIEAILNSLKGKELNNVFIHNDGTICMEFRVVGCYTDRLLELIPQSCGTTLIRLNGKLIAEVEKECAKNVTVRGNEVKQGQD